jgi:hypothetical protein
MHTYRALLHGNRLEWLEDAPASPTDVPVSVHVTVLEHEPVSEQEMRGHAMAALLEKLAERHTFASLQDPVQWQRDLRVERSLPGRE